MDINFSLSGLAVGQSARVAALNCDGQLKRRLADMGMITGTEIKCLAQSPLGDPRAYLVRGAVIALRRQDSGGILMGGGAGEV